MTDNVEGTRFLVIVYKGIETRPWTATAQLLASGYRSKNVRVLLVNPRSIVPISGSRFTAGDPRIAVDRIVTHVTEGGSVESGIRVL